MTGLEAVFSNISLVIVVVSSIAALVMAPFVISDIRKRAKEGRLDGDGRVF